MNHSSVLSNALRRTFRCLVFNVGLISGLLLLTAPVLVTAAYADDLTIGTWGDAYEAAQESALFQPFEQSSGLTIETTPYHGGLSILTTDDPPALLDMLEEDAQSACEQGLLRKLDIDELFGTDESSATVDDFAKGAFDDCSVAHLTFATLVAYDERAFPGEKPQQIGDLFDLERFPGKRALQKNPSALFEWAMMAEGVPVSQVYDLLSTDRGLQLVLRRLDVLKDQILWWETPAQAVAYLESGDAVMASGYNGRFFDAWLRGAPVSMIWDGQIIDRSVWAIPAGSSTDPLDALLFIRFAIAAQRQAHIARQIPYGPTRQSAFRFIGLHEESGIVMDDHLPTATHHLGNALYRDTHWYARTEALRQQVFDAWLEGFDDVTQGSP